MEQSSIKGKVIINEKLAKLSSFKELTFFFLKYSFTISKILGSVILLVIVFFGTIAQVPYYFAFGLTENIALFTISSLVYGSTFYTFRKSTIFENMQETNLSKKEIYLAIFISMFLFTGLIFLFGIAFFTIFIKINSVLLIPDWFFSTNDNFTGSAGYSLNELNIQLLFWWYIAFIFINFGLFYLFQNISNTKKGFYLFIFLYLVLLIIYGNTANPPSIWISQSIFLESHEKLMKILMTDNDYFTLTENDIKKLMYYFHIPAPLTLSNNIAKKFENERYIAGFFAIILPHSWINSFCSGTWRATALQSYTLSSTTDWANPITFTYSENTAKNAPIWKFNEQIWWALSMYLWIFYFILLYLIGTTISHLKKFN